MITVAHTKTVVGADDPTKEVNAGEWNGAAAHTLAGTITLTTDVAGILPTANGGTGIAYFTAAGPTVARVYTFPDAAATMVYSAGPLGTPSSGTLTNCTGLPEAGLTLADNTTDNVTSTAHGFAPKSPAAATQFLNGAATPAYAQVKDSDLALTDIVTNNASATAHGFLPKWPNNTTTFLRGDGTYAAPSGSSAAAGAQLYTALYCGGF